MKRSLQLLIILLGALSTLSACGGGGGGSAPTDGDNPPPTQSAPTKAVVKLIASGPAGAQIGGIDVTLNLPAGVTIKSTANPPAADAGVVVASGQAIANSLVVATYTAASGGTQATVHVVLANSGQNGFAVGEFATITCDLAPGANPAAADFTIKASTVDDINGVVIAGATVGASATMTGGSTGANPTTAVVKLSTSGPAGAQIGGIDVTVNLPPGVTVRAASNPPQADPGVVIASGQAASNSTITGIYTAASGGSPATVRVVVANGGQNGLAIGEFATITCDLASGANPAAADFTIKASTAADLNGTPVAGVTVTIGATLQ